jgi:hypothetical protein
MGSRKKHTDMIMMAYAIAAFLVFACFLLSLIPAIVHTPLSSE